MKRGTAALLGALAVAAMAGSGGVASGSAEVPGRGPHEVREGLQWWWINPASVRVLVGRRTAREALSEAPSARLVAPGPMFDSFGPLYGIGSGGRVVFASRRPNEGSTIAYANGDLVAVQRWAPSGEWSVQGYPTLVAEGHPTGVRGPEVTQRCALVIVGRRLAVVRGVVSLPELAARVQRAGARAAVYLDGGHAGVVIERGSASEGPRLQSWLAADVAEGVAPGHMNVPAPPSATSAAGRRPVLNPRTYAEGKLRMLSARWSDERIRSAADAWRGLWLPGAPTTAALAGGASSMGAGEWIGTPPTATGLYGLEVPRLQAWSRDDRTIRDLGRSVSTDRTAYARDIEGQTYLGFRSYAAHRDACVARLPESLRDASPQWRYRLALASYSSGEGNVARLLTALERELSPVAPVLRWRRVALAVVDAARAGRHHIGGVAIRGAWQAAHTVIRNDQRWESGKLLAENVAPGEAPWFEGSPASTRDTDTWRDLVALAEQS